MAVSVIAVVGIVVVIIVIVVQQDAVTLTPDRSEDRRGCVLVVGLVGETVFGVGTPLDRRRALDELADEALRGAAVRDVLLAPVPVDVKRGVGLDRTPVVHRVDEVEIVLERQIRHVEARLVGCREPHAVAGKGDRPEQAFGSRRYSTRGVPLKALVSLST